MSYANEGQLENYLTIDIDNSLSSQITEWSLAVDLYIDKYCNRTFKDEGTETRYFDGDGSKELDIDDFQSLNTVEILEPNSDDTMFSLVEGREEDYMVYPYNGIPKYRLIMTPVSKSGNWKKGTRNIKVNADWGRAAVPEDIQLAATILLAGVIEKGVKGGSVLQESLGDYSVTFKEADDISGLMGVKDILSKYKLWEM
jgi:hypothetical protein